MIDQSNNRMHLLPRQSIENFVENTNMKFDIMNLDYQGYFALKKNNLIKKITEKGMLSDKSVLATWFSGRRESEKTQNWKESWNYSETEGILKPLIENYKKDPNELLKLMIESSYKRLDEIGAGEDRNEFISKKILRSLLFPGFESKHHPYLEFLGNKKDYISIFEKDEEIQKRNKNFLKILLENKEKLLHDDELYSIEQYETFKKIKELAKKQQPIPDELKLKLYQPFGIVGYLNYMIPLTKRKLKGYFNSIGISTPEESITPIATIISESPFKNYFLKKNERYFYHSDKGTPMYLDINSFLREDASKIIPFKIKDKKILIPKSALRNKKLYDRIEKHQKLQNESLENYIKFNERKELIPEQEKSPAKIPSPLVETNKFSEKKLSKEEVYLLLKEGKTDKQILSIDPYQNPRTISAYKAHLTMDRLGIKKGRPKKNKLETKVMNFQSQSKDEFSKEEAIFLLREGFTPKEIIEQYSDEFSLHQLAAFQAWYVTMGKQKLA